MKKEFFTNRPSQTKKLGKDLAKQFLKRPLEKRALVIGLIGDLGGGKTTFLQGFAEGLGIKERIVSPTFIIMRKFQIPDFEKEAYCSHAKFKNFYHMDCYRIQNPKQILELGFKRIISDRKNIVAIEWADRIAKILPKNIIIIKFHFVNKNSRQIIIQSKEIEDTDKNK